MQYCSGNKTLKFWFFVPTGKERYKQNKTVLEIAEPDDFEFSCWDRSELKKPLKSTLIVKISQVAEMLGNAGCAKLSCTFSHLKRSDWPLVPNPSPLSISSLLLFISQIFLCVAPLCIAILYHFTFYSLSVGDVLHHVYASSRWQSLGRLHLIAFLFIEKGMLINYVVTIFL